MTSLYPAPELKVNAVLTSLWVLQIFSFHQQVDFLTDHDPKPDKISFV